jgi:predicted membrane protein (TIGR00267 family)
MVKPLVNRLRLLLGISGTHTIMRRYAVVNGFDGALTLLGMLLGFYISQDVPLLTIINACLGVSVALAVSGISSAYLSESAEQQQALAELRGAMVSDMADSAHSRAAALAPVMVALANGGSPLIMGLVIMVPLWLGHLGIVLVLTPLEAALATAVALIFLLGVFLGRVRGSSLLISGLLTLLIAAVTAGLILLLGRP